MIKITVGDNNNGGLAQSSTSQLSLRWYYDNVSAPAHNTSVSSIGNKSKASHTNILLAGLWVVLKFSGEMIPVFTTANTTLWNKLTASSPQEGYSHIDCEDYSHIAKWAY